MPLSDYVLGSAVSVLAGLDRTAALQLMVSRPLVAGPLTGWLVGDALAGLQIGAMVELLWLGRLPVGAAIPPDDTQVTVAATVMTVAMGEALGFSGVAFAILCLLVALPLGKFGQYCERFARERNAGLLSRAEQSLAAGELKTIERLHLRGLGHFALASFLTYVVVVVAGSMILSFLAPLALGPISASQNWLKIAFPLVGAATILVTINVNRALVLFGAAFASSFLLLWLL